MKRLWIPLLRNNSAVSYAISAVIMTAAIMTLVLVASGYAYQILEQQRGATEFDVARKSILAFNDALENIAWKPQASRSARFTVNYGQLELMPDMPLIVTVTDYPNASYSNSTGYIIYSTKTKYVSFGEPYSSYFLGDNGTLSNGAGSYGRASIEQKSGWVSMTLSYGVRAMKTSTIKITQGNETVPVKVNSVDIWIIRINITKRSTYIGDFDLKAKCLDVKTIPYGGPYGYDVVNNQCNISVQLGNNPLDTALIQLDGDKVVFNFVIATVQVSV